MYYKLHIKAVWAGRRTANIVAAILASVTIVGYSFAIQMPWYCAHVQYS